MKHEACVTAYQHLIDYENYFIQLTKYLFYPDSRKSIIAYFGKNANIRNLWNVKNHL